MKISEAFKQPVPLYQRGRKDHGGTIHEGHYGPR
jgi:hypothetical protein